MFNKLKSFSEDVAKSFNEISQNDPRKDNGAIKQLKEGERVLQRRTPDVSELLQPSDDSDPAATEVKNGVSGDSGAVVSGARDCGAEVSGDSVNPATPSKTNDENGADEKQNTDPLANIEMESLPPLVQSKLRKFVKYEDKYPVLLDAYKTEKNKSRLIAIFEKTLLEFTPILSIADVALLVDYLKGLTDKASIMESELRRSASEKSLLLKEKEEFIKKVHDHEKALKYSEEALTTRAKEEEVLKSKIKDLESKFEEHQAKISEIEDSKKKLVSAEENTQSVNISTDASEKVTELEAKLKALGNIASEVKDLSAANIQLENELAAQKELNGTQYIELDALKQELEEKSKKLDDFAASKVTFEEESVNEISKLKEKLSAKSQECDDIAKTSKQTSVDLQNCQDKLKEMKNTIINKDYELKELKEMLKAKDQVISDKEKIFKAKEQELMAKISEQKDFTLLEEAIDSKTLEISVFKSKCDALDQKANDQLTLIEELETLKRILQDEKDELQDRLTKIEEGLKSSVSEEPTKEPSVAEGPKADVVSATEGRTSKKNRKKNKKSRNTELEPAPEVQFSKPAEVEIKQVPESQLIDLQTQFEALSKEKEDIVNELRSCKSEMNKKIEDLDILKDLLRDIGDELVTVKDKLKNSELICASKAEEELNEVKMKEKELQTQLEEKSNELTKLTDQYGALSQELQDAYEQLNKSKEIALSLKLDSEKKAMLIEESKKIIEEKNNAIEASEKLSVAKDAESQKLSEELEKVKGQLVELHKKLNLNTEQLNASIREKDSLELEKQQLNSRVDELLKFKSGDASLKLEIASLQSSISHKDEQIREYKASIESKNAERDQMNSTIATLKANNKELQLNHKSLVSEKNSMQNKIEEVLERSTALTSEISKLQISKQEVATELESLKLKYDSLFKSRSSSSGEIQALKQQYDELSIRTKDSQGKIDDLEEELSEARRMLQDRTRENSVMRRMLSEAKEEYEQKYGDIKGEVNALNDENATLLSDLQSVRKRSQREIEELNSETEKYSKRVVELQKEAKILRDQLAAANQTQQSISPEDVQKQRDLESTVNELRTSLQKASEKSREFENLNQVLKKLNDESNSKFDRLTKNYKLITQQYRQMKELKDRLTSASSSRKLSISETDKSPPAVNVAYLKNVLIGFLEHKEQREQLLPVVTTLFQLDSSEEKKLMVALK